MSGVEWLPHRSWPELVMHVLAHVPVAVPAGLFDPIYVAFAARHAGNAEERELSEDARALAQILTTHADMARVQLLAWLFDDLEQALACAEHDLMVLEATQVARPELLAPLRALEAPVELLRCAALLEEEAMAKLPPVSTDMRALAALFEELAPIAPGLAEHALLPVRALRLRGRVREREIWIGVPSAELGLDAEHVAFIACHEATVHELSALGGDERRVETAALALMGERAAAAGLTERHARWLSHLG